jgi:hypothetical protein
LAETIGEDEVRQMIGQAHHCLVRNDAAGALTYLNRLQSAPQLEGPPLRQAVLWGLLGDAYFALGKVELGLAAYHRSLDVIPWSPCAATYAKNVAKFGLASEASRALAALDAEDVAYRKQSFLLRFWRSVYAIMYVPKSWFHSVFIMPGIKRNLRELRDQHNAASDSAPSEP